MLWTSMLPRAIAFWLINFMQIKQWIANYMLKLFPKAIFWCDFAALEYELISEERVYITIEIGCKGWVAMVIQVIKLYKNS